MYLRADRGHVFMGRMPCLLLATTCLWLTMGIIADAAGNSSSNSSSSSLPPSSRPTAVAIGSLFTRDSVIGKAAKPAIQAAIDDVNADSSILPGTELNLLEYDTNCSGFLGTVEGTA